VTSPFAHEAVSDEIEEIGQVLGEVEEALARLERGGYGHCEECGEMVEAAALDADPLLRHCAKHRRAVQP
jgi:RNA polymerase-binding transcription factor DksA